MEMGKLFIRHAKIRTEGCPVVTKLDFLKKRGSARSLVTTQGPPPLFKRYKKWKIADKL